MRNNEDIYYEKFSFGISMENRIQFVISNTIKYYFALKQLSENYQKNITSL